MISIKRHRIHGAVHFRADLLGCVVLGLMGSGLASAQVSNPASAAGQASTSRGAAQDELQEVVVTAERRSENLQTVAISAVVRTGEQLKTEQIYNSESLQNIVPSLSIQPSTTGAVFVNMRGVGLQQTNPASSNGVAFYVDGVFDPTYTQGLDTFYDLQNVEVLRGPQGTLVGSNADGGAIFINSVKPSFDRIKGYAEQIFGNFGELRTEAAINLPISETFATRVSVVRETQNSFTTNVGPEPPTGLVPGGNNQPGNVNNSAVRLQISFKPNEDFIATIRYEPYTSRNDGAAVKPDMVNFKPGFPGYSPTSYDPYAASIQNNKYTIDYNTNQYYNLTGQRSALNAVWNINAGLELKAVSGYITGEERDLADVDQSSAPSDQTLTRKQSWRTFTQELNLLSTSSSALQWVVGAYYQSSNSPLQLTFLNPTFPFPMNQTSLSVVPEHTTEAGFASATYTFSPQWSVMLGGRYSHDNSPFNETLCTGFAQTCGNYSVSDNEPTGTGKVSFQVTPDTLIYTSVASGYKAGGENLHLQFPAIGFAFDPPPFLPETNVVEELGLKTTVLNDHLRLDVDGYNSVYHNYQIQQFLGGIPYTQGPGKSKIYGAEGEAIGVFNALRLTVGGSYTHATVSENFLYSQNIGPPVVITAGTTMPFAPEWMFNAALQYTIPVGQGTLTPRVQYQYQASQYVNLLHEALPSADQELPSHATVDFNLTYAAAEHWSVQGYVKNLANNQYVAQILLSPQPAAAGLQYSAPRQMGVKLDYSF
jgi:iron complex outermembrane recepter protein